MEDWVASSSARTAHQSLSPRNSSHPRANQFTGKQTYYPITPLLLHRHPKHQWGPLTWSVRRLGSSWTTMMMMMRVQRNPVVAAASFLPRSSSDMHTVHLQTGLLSLLAACCLLVDCTRRGPSHSARERDHDRERGCSCCRRSCCHWRRGRRGRIIREREGWAVHEPGGPESPTQLNQGVLLKATTPSGHCPEEVVWYGQYRVVVVAAWSKNLHRQTQISIQGLYC